MEIFKQYWCQLKKAWGKPLWAISATLSSTLGAADWIQAKCQAYGFCCKGDTTMIFGFPSWYLGTILFLGFTIFGLLRRLVLLDKRNKDLVTSPMDTTMADALWYGVTGDWGNRVEVYEKNPDKFRKHLKKVPSLAREFEQAARTGTLKIWAKDYVQAAAGGPLEEVAPIIWKNYEIQGIESLSKKGTLLFAKQVRGHPTGNNKWDLMTSRVAVEEMAKRKKK